MENQAFFISSSVVLFALGIFGILANVTTLCVLARSKTLSGPFYILLMSLCVSDVCSGVISFLLAVATSQPTFPNNPAYRYGELLAYLPSIVTTLHVCAFSVLRFVSVQWPRKDISPILAKWTIALMWTFSLLAGLAFAFVFLAHPEHYSMLAIISSTVTEALLLALMIVVTIFTCALVVTIQITKRKISSHLSDSDKKRRDSNYRFIVIQLVLIVVSFYFGYIPLCVYLDLLIYAHKNNIMSSHVLRIAAYLCLRVSECLNPLFYNIASEKLRKETKVFLTDVWSKGSGLCLCCAARNEQSEGQEEYLDLQNLNPTTQADLL